MIFPDMYSLNDALLKDDKYKPVWERSHSYADGWGTHIPLLASVMATAAPGPVLEIGVGRSSSPLLVEMCRASGRDLTGIDQDQGWLNEIGDLPYPKLVHMPNWQDLIGWLDANSPDHINGYSWSVIFIDHGPGEWRLPVLKMARPYGNQIVCHDTLNPGYLVGLDDELDTFKHRYDYTLMASCTSVVSDLKAY